MTTAAMIAFLASVFAGALTTAITIRVAPKFGLVDRPDNRRKLHSTTVSLGGGLAVYLAVCIVISAVLVLPNPWNLVLQHDWREVLAYFVASTWIVTLGLVDDRFGLRGRHKLAGQMIAAFAMMAGGLVIQRVGLFGMGLDLGYMAIPFTLFWFLGGMNSINLLDGVDGLASTIGIILTVTLAILAAMTGHPAVAMIALVFAGALAGFLFFNLPPARIFLGDAGSMLIGLIVAALAIQASLKTAGTVLLAAPLAVWLVPILDSSLAIIRRKLTGRSIYSTDRAHLHHRLLQRLGTTPRVLAMVALICGATCLAALASVAWNSDIIALAAVGAVTIILAVSRLFGEAELSLVASRVRHAVRSVLQPFSKSEPVVHSSSVQLQGQLNWDELWELLTNSANELRLEKILLDVDVPSIHESYNGFWERPTGAQRDALWHMEFPLKVESDTVGRLSVTGTCNGEPTHRQIARLVELVEPFENDLRELAGEQLAAVPVAPASSSPFTSNDDVSGIGYSVTRKHPH